MANISSINGNPIVVGTSGVSDGAVTSAKLANNAVTTEKIANGSVSDAKMSDSGIKGRVSSYCVSDGSTRNGSPGNVGNANAISMTSAMPVTADLYEVAADLSAPSGYEYKWTARLQHASSGYFEQTAYTRVPYAVFEIDRNEFTTVQFGLEFISYDRSTYSPIRVESVGTNVIHAIPFHSISPVLKPTVRDGSSNSASSTTQVATAFVQEFGDEDAVEVRYDGPLSADEVLTWEVAYIQSVNRASNGATVARFDRSLTHMDRRNILIDNSGETAGYSVSVYKIDTVAGTTVPLRVASVGNCLSISKVYRQSDPLTGTDSYYRPVLRNGSTGNTGNANAISMASNVLIDGADYVVVSYADYDELPDGYEIYASFRTYESSGASASTSYIREYNFNPSRNTMDYKGRNIVIPLARGEKYFAACVFAYNKVTNAYVPLRVIGHPKAMAVRLGFGNSGASSSSGGGIVDRNADVLPAVNAASRFGNNGNGIANWRKQLSMLVCTDVHRCVDQMSSFISYLNNTGSIDCGICLGDMAASNYSESNGKWYTDLVNKSQKPMYTTIGNHDGGNSASASISATKQEVFAKWIEPTLEVMGMPSLTKTYYSVNFSSYPVTLIVLDNYDVPDDVTGTTFAVSRGVEAISQAQLDWFVATLKAMPSGNHLVIARHSTGGTDYDLDESRVFTSTAYKTIGGSVWGYQKDPIPDIVEAWRNGSAIESTYIPNEDYLSLLPTLVVSDTFASRESGRFACYLTGHVHRDQIMRHKTYGHLCIALDTTANDNYQTEWTDLPRAKGTKAEDCITVVSIDTYSNSVKLVRVGSNVTMDLVERTMETIPYVEG